MPRPTPLTHLGPGTILEEFNTSLSDYLRSLSDADKLSLINALRAGTLFGGFTASMALRRPATDDPEPETVEPPTDADEGA